MSNQNENRVHLAGIEDNFIQIGRNAREIKRLTLLIQRKNGDINNINDAVDAVDEGLNKLMNKEVKHLRDVVEGG